VSKLFLENNYLLSGFKKFLPNGYKISMGDLRQADQAYAREDEMKVKRGKAVALRAVVSNGFNKVGIQRKYPNAVYTPRLFSRHMTESTKLIITTNCIVEKRDKQSGIDEGGGAKRRKVSSPQPNATFSDTKTGSRNKCPAPKTNKHLNILISLTTTTTCQNTQQYKYLRNQRLLDSPTQMPRLRLPQMIS
jgi:hypothetical protein